jgi:hypothetical protein
MSPDGQSLRRAIEKWFGAGPSACIRLRREQAKAFRCISVETVTDSGLFSILFFRHADGSWCVFPPEKRRLELGLAHRSISSTDNSGSYELAAA